jgi:hypothetical protein
MTLADPVLETGPTEPLRRTLAAIESPPRCALVLLVGTREARVGF